MTGRCRHCGQPIREYLPGLFESPSDPGQYRCGDGSLLDEYHEPFGPPA